jgi:hypothetical protein
LKEDASKPLLGNSFEEALKIFFKMLDIPERKGIIKECEE